MKLLFFIFLTISIAFSQCDANDDSQLDVLDIVVQVNCILNDSTGPLSARSKDFP